ncbi:MAG: CDP-alcohol phosphatidyltransferase family protein [Methanomicrobiales archaeon]|nr:CDP-alcohol phosphatidyltransferase family protein [Methanomicrobiales archaeon]
MNITALRPKLVAKLEPLAQIFIKIGLTPNQVSLLSLILGLCCAWLFFTRAFFAGSCLLLLSGILDLVDGTVARKKEAESDFGAVIDWIIDKYVDAASLLGIGLSGIPVISAVVMLPAGTASLADFGITTVAIIGSMMNTFIKPVVYAEVGYHERQHGKINDPLEGIGFFGRPETLIVLILGGLTGYIWLSVIVVAACTNLSAIQRIAYLYRRLS